MRSKPLPDFSLAGIITVALLAALIAYLLLVFTGVIGIGGLHD